MLHRIVGSEDQTWIYLEQRKKKHSENHLREFCVCCLSISRGNLLSFQVKWSFCWCRLAWSEIPLLVDEVEGFCWSDTAFHGPSGVHGWILARMDCSERGRPQGWRWRNIGDTLKSSFSFQHICCEELKGVNTHSHHCSAQVWCVVPWFCGEQGRRYFTATIFALGVPLSGNFSCRVKNLDT